MGCYNSGSTVQWRIYSTNTTALRISMPESDARMTDTDGNHPSYIIGSRRGVNDAEAYLNGVSNITDAATASATNLALTHYLFAANSEGIGAAGFSEPTLTFAHIGSSYTDTDASNKSEEVNLLMYRAGCDTYVTQSVIDAMDADGVIDADVKTYAEAVLAAGGNR